ncbi:2-hydroxyacid dehydrogenase [Mycolicibacterium neworleansense]|uniref:Phosphoglycerate dehydrogenase n=1 Tax=Mycolicibacterium neworleansense TaxID=146018 RepID=A0A0H5RVR5_9MYCO|nr:2-hydroxyacid dehydrogenase [Mycolicibacterium neworleansense]MCV7360511.1 hydroxyacid dehydrogenase [Mycolicibacterium neworleansense]CRZ17871.1 phosphoglycerate dehydrogenase [Mycolicibacterium neworleansense]
MKIVVADSYLIAHRDRLEAALPERAAVSWHVPGDSRIVDDLRDAEVFVGSRFTAEMAAVADRLRLVHVNGAGTDKIDFDGLGSEVMVANTFNHEQSIAEYIAGAAVMLRRHLLEQDRALRTGRWASPGYDRTIGQSSSLQGACVGFVGFGHIGRSSWNLLRAFGADGAAVTGSGNLDATAEGLRWAAGSGGLDQLMAESELVVVCAPLTEQTVGMIGAPQLGALGASGVLINVGRGPLVVESALYEALSTGVIAAAAIDVWYRYPDATGYGEPAELPFHTLPNVLMTPHVSGVTANTFAARADDIAVNIGRLERGEPLNNLVR